jgi:hypothetical protein
MSWRQSHDALLGAAWSGSATTHRPAGPAGAATARVDRPEQLSPDRATATGG